MKTKNKPDEAKDLKSDATSSEGGDSEEEVTPDPLVTCPKCRNRFRIGKKAGA